MMRGSIPAIEERGGQNQGVWRGKAHSETWCGVSDEGQQTSDEGLERGGEGMKGCCYNLGCFCDCRAASRH